MVSKGELQSVYTVEREVLKKILHLFQVFEFEVVTSLSIMLPDYTPTTPRLHPGYVPLSIRTLTLLERRTGLSSLW